MPNTNATSADHATSASDLTPSDDLGVYAWFSQGEAPPAGSMPAANMNTTPFLYEAYCQTTDAGRAPLHRFVDRSASPNAARAYRLRVVKLDGSRAWVAAATAR